MIWIGVWLCAAVLAMTAWFAIWMVWRFALLNYAVIDWCFIQFGWKDVLVEYRLNDWTFACTVPPEVVQGYGLFTILMDQLAVELNGLGYVLFKEAYEAAGL